MLKIYKANLKVEVAQLQKQLKSLMTTKAMPEAKAQENLVADVWLDSEGG